MRFVLIAGVRGTLGHAFERACRERHLAYRATARAELDIADPQAVGVALDRLHPWVVINATGYARIDDAEGEAARCQRDNERAPVTLAAACAARGIGCVTLSSDLVFDGAKGAPYTEHDRPAPLGVYGRSKHASEVGVRAAHPHALVVRTGACFGPWDRSNFAVASLRTLRSGQVLAAAADVFVSPTYIPDLVHACLDLAIDGATGLWHLASPGVVSWAALAIAVARAAGHAEPRIVPTPAADMHWRATRPRFSALTSVRGVLLPPLEDALRRFERERDKELS